MSSKIYKFLFFLTCLIHAVSARLPLSDMFHFEIKEYIPYIIVTLILMIAFIPIRRFGVLRYIITVIFGIFLGIVFPPIFFYETQGFSKLTIVTIAFSCATTVILIISRLPSLFTDEANRMTMLKVNIAILSLILFVFPPLFIYATESFNSITITYLSLYYSILITILLSLCVGENELSGICTILLFLEILATFIYSIVLIVKFSIPHFYITILVVNLVVGCCCSCLQGTIIGAITGCILGGINYYVLFYTLLNQVNKISLLFFWSDLWATLFSLYATIEFYMLKELAIRDEDLPGLLATKLKGVS